MEQSSPDKEHFVLSYACYRSDEFEIGNCDPFYTSTKVEGGWGKQMRPSFGPWGRQAGLKDRLKVSCWRRAGILGHAVQIPFSWAKQK